MESADAKKFGWQNASSRIIRVSRVSGGKDRHSKVWTTKGLRDRRVRLSVSTAIQFYDLQDRLGYDQPSKAVDWLIKAADAAIADLPELEGEFPAPPAMQTEISPSKSTCSSGASETSERRKREREQTSLAAAHSSFTELLTAGSDCGVFGQHAHARRFPQFVPGYPLHGCIAGGGEQQEMQQYSFVQDHVIPVVDHDLNVSISSVFAGFNRGTLQSNSPYYHHHVVDGGSLPFLFGASIPIAAAAAEGAAAENQYLGGFNGRLQVCCNEAHRHPKMKGEGKG